MMTCEFIYTRCRGNYGTVESIEGSIGVTRARTATSPAGASVPDREAVV